MLMEGCHGKSWRPSTGLPAGRGVSAITRRLAVAICCVAGTLAGKESAFSDRFPTHRLAHEQFLYTGSDQVCRLIDEAGNRAGVSRGQAFEDFLSCAVCALSARQMEEEYLAVVAKGYGEGKHGRRGIDSLTRAFATLISLMEETRRDILGDVFQGGITYGEAGQFLTPENLCTLMAAMSLDADQQNEVVCDPCCGSGRMLLAYADQKRAGELIGQDVDLRCVRMTAMNMALRNLYGYVLWGNSLAHEVKLGYRTGMNMYGGFIRHMRPGELAEKVAAPAGTEAPQQPRTVNLPRARSEGPAKQLDLF